MRGSSQQLSICQRRLASRALSIALRTREWLKQGLLSRIPSLFLPSAAKSVPLRVMISHAASVNCKELTIGLSFATVLNLRMENRVTHERGGHQTKNGNSKKIIVRLKYHYRFVCKDKYLVGVSSKRQQMKLCPSIRNNGASIVQK